VSRVPATTSSAAAATMPISAMARSCDFNALGSLRAKGHRSTDRRERPRGGGRAIIQTKPSTSCVLRTY